MQQNRQTNAKAIASLVLSCASMICCVQWSISLVMAVLGIVFGILGLRDDNPNQEDAAIAGIIGLILSAIGLVLNAVILAYGIWMIRWDHMTIENLSSIQNLNPANEKDIIEWLQQFIKVDISGMVN